MCVSGTGYDGLATKNEYDSQQETIIVMCVSGTGYAGLATKNEYDSQQESIEGD